MMGTGAKNVQMHMTMKSGNNYNNQSFGDGQENSLFLTETSQLQSNFKRGPPLPNIKINSNNLGTSTGVTSPSRSPCGVRG